MAEEKYRLKTRLPNGAEFEAEGSEEVVKGLFDKFLQALKEASNRPDTVVLPADRIARAGPSTASQLLTRIFAEDNNGEISLRALPQTESRDADAMLLLLYGYQVLKGEQTVMAGKLKRSARQSGVVVDRADRTLAPHGTLITRAGSKKASKYGLNNQGVKKAEEILNGIMG
jgi:hypothetical protein